MRQSVTGRDSFVAGLRYLLRPLLGSYVVTERKAEWVICSPGWIGRITWRGQRTVRVTLPNNVYAADFAVIAIISCIEPVKPHESVLCRHICANNAGGCVKSGGPEDYVLERDRSVHCGHTCGKHLEFVYHEIQEQE